MANSLNSTFYYIFRNLSEIPYIIEIKKSKFAYIYFHEFVRSDPGQLTKLCIYFHPEVGYMILKIIHYTLTVIPYLWGSVGTSKQKINKNINVIF